jgi:Tfp pilus assembly protein PilX
MKKSFFTDITRQLSNEHGAAIGITILILAVLVIIGVVSISTSNVELQISSSDARHKIAFHAADGATEFGSELLEQNICCASGFQTSTIGAVEVPSTNFWMNLSATKPTDSNRDFYFPGTYSSSEPHTNLTVGGETVLALGGAIQMAAGYEGKGKGAPSGGAHIIYDIFAERIGRFNSKSLVMLQWRHVVGQEGSCPY